MLVCMAQPTFAIPLLLNTAARVMNLRPPPMPNSATPKASSNKPAVKCLVRCCNM